MKLGITGLGGRGASPERLFARARAAEAAGFDSIWVGDHVVLPADGTRFAADTPFLDPVVQLAFLAAATSTIRLALGVIQLPLRQPLVLAKQLATLDALSNGRLIFGLGVGSLEAEFEAVQVGFTDRGTRADDYLAAMRAIWAEDTAAYEGKFVSFRNVLARPLPVQRPVPVVVGGYTRAAYRRTAQQAQGFYGYGLSPADARRVVSQLAQYARPAELGELEITIAPPGPLERDSTRAYEEAGVHRLVLRAPEDGDFAVLYSGVT